MQTVAKKSPRPHQKEAIEAVKQGFEMEDRGKLIMALTRPL
jgi:predicted helicase